LARTYDEDHGSIHDDQLIMLEFMINRCSYQNAEHAMRHDEDHTSNHDEKYASKLGYNHDSIHDKEG
jgi:hypothetical protein